MPVRLLDPTCLAVFGLWKRSAACLIVVVVAVDVTKSTNIPTWHVAQAEDWCDWRLQRRLLYSDNNIFVPWRRRGHWRAVIQWCHVCVTWHVAHARCLLLNYMTLYDLMLNLFILQSAYIGRRCLLASPRDDDDHKTVCTIRLYRHVGLKLGLRTQEAQWIIDGVAGNVLSWIQSYLTGRTQSVRIGSHSSPPNPCSVGVPQGSVL